MRGRKRWVFPLTCVLAAFFALSAGATQQEVDAAKKEATSIEAEMKKLEETLSALEALKNDAAAYVRELDASLVQYDQELEALAGEIADKEAEIAVTQEEWAAAKETQQQQYADMKLRIKYMYEWGETSLLDLLLQAQDLSQLMNRAEYIASISAYDREKLDEYEATQELIAEKEAELETEREELLSMQAETAARQEAAETLLAEKEAELKSFESRISEAEGQISDYEADLAAQEAKIAALEEEIRRKEEEARKAAEAASQAYATVNIGDLSFTWPCPASSRITSYFGDRESPTEGASTNHKGIDIGASGGTAIVAAEAGTVVLSTYSYSAGNYLMISHGGGVYTVYMHCSQLLVSEGESVSRGSTIAKVGSTGYSTGPHLHFGIRVDGSYVNPLAYVSP